MWFDEAADTSPIVTPGDMRLALSINGVAVVLLGLMPGSLLGACMSAMTKTLGS
jgi:NADH-quinone oxidoreductase subunit N